MRFPTVSYTHLDVYKRQALFTTSTRNAAPSNVFHAAQTKEPYGMPFNAVSYTHLARYAEYGSTGEGAPITDRVKWAKQLTKKEAALYDDCLLYTSRCV